MSSEVQNLLAFVGKFPKEVATIILLYAPKILSERIRFPETAEFQWFTGDTYQFILIRLPPPSGAFETGHATSGITGVYNAYGEKIHEIEVSSSRWFWDESEKGKPIRPENCQGKEAIYLSDEQWRRLVYDPRHTLKWSVTEPAVWPVGFKNKKL